MRNQNITKLIYLSLSAIFFFGAIYAFFSSINKEPTKENTKPIISASIGPIASITSQIAGDNFEVNQILPAGVSPHTFSLKISDVLQIQESEAVFVIGHGLDDWAVEQLESRGNVVILSSGISLLEHDGHDEHEEDIHEDEEHTYDPHYWLSIENAITISKTIKVELSKIDPDNAEVYMQNQIELELQLRQLKEDSLSRISNLSDNKIITFHGAFNYFAEELGINIVAVVEEFPGSEPSAQYLREVGKVIEEQNVRVLFKEPQLSDAVVGPLAEDYGANVFTLDPLGGNFSSMTYQDLYKTNVDQIVDALSN